MASVYTTYDSLPIFLSVEDLCSVLSIGRNTAYDMVRAGQIKSIRCGRQIRIPKAAVQDLVQ